MKYILPVILLSFCLKDMVAQPIKKIGDLYNDLQIKKDTALINSLFELALVQNIRNDLDSAMFYYKKGLKLAEKIKYYKGLTVGNRGLGMLYIYRIQHDSAMSAFLDALHNADKVSEDRLLHQTRAKERIAVAYMSVGDTAKAFRYLTEIKDPIDQLKDTALMIERDKDLVFYYGIKMDTVAALSYYQNAMKLCDALENKYLANNDDGYLLSNLDRRRTDIIIQAYPLFNSVDLYKKAIPYAEKMVDRKNIADHRFAMGKTWLLLAALYNGIDDNEKAVKYANLALSDSTMFEKDKMDAYGVLAKAYYYEDKMEEAFDNLYLYHQEFEKKFSNEKAATIAGLETKYQTEKKEEQIAALNKEKRSQRILIAVSTGALLIALGLLLFLIRAKRLQRRLFMNEKELQKKEMEKRMSELEQTALRAQMNPHFIFNSLNSVQRFVINNDVEGVNQYLSTFANLIRQTLENSGKQLIPLSHEVKYLETYLKLEQMRSNDKFNYRININSDVDPEETYIPNMIIQPYLENSVIHGMAGKKQNEGIINLTISKNHKLTCVVEDNGTGISTSKANKKQIDTGHESMGTAITEKRIEMFNIMNNEKIELEVLDKSGLDQQENGTKVMIKFPLTSSAN